MEAESSRSGAFGATVRQRRKQLGITQQELAELAECGALFVLQLEHGKPTVRLDKLLAVLNVLNLQLRLEIGNGGLVADGVVTD